MFSSRIKKKLHNEQNKKKTCKQRKGEINVSNKKKIEPTKSINTKMRYLIDVRNKKKTTTH